MIAQNRDFDLIIIGGGAGAFASAIKANELGVKTLMVNFGLPLGGTCVNVGCVPSKALIHAAEVLYRSRHHDIPGIEIGIKKFDFKKVVRDELSLVEKLRKEKYEKTISYLKNVSVINGRASFISKNEIEVNGEKLAVDKFIIAAGSTATIPQIKNIREVGFLTHIEALQIQKQPKELIVVGAGPLGLEFAQMYSRFGAKVTILQRGNSIFAPAEKELTDRLRQILENEGIVIKTNVEVKSARKEGNKKALLYTINGKQDKVAGDEILLATGKTPNTAGLGLENAKVNIDEKQAIIVNNFFQTSQSRIFAVGDIVNLPLRLETTAGREGTLAAENLIKGLQLSIDYNAVPYTIFTDPQLAGVGYTEDAQMKAMGVCACRAISFADVPKAVIMRRTEGLLKMATDPRTKQILGVHILAPNAGELIAEAMMLIKNKNTIDDVVNSLPMFPTLSEAIKLAAMSFTKDISKLSCCI